MKNRLKFLIDVRLDESIDSTWALIITADNVKLALALALLYLKEQETFMFEGATWLIRAHPMLLCQRAKSWPNGTSDMMTAEPSEIDCTVKVDDGVILCDEELPAVHDVGDTGNGKSR